MGQGVAVPGLNGQAQEEDTPEVLGTLREWPRQVLSSLLG